jgi:hypothetical protein
LALDDLQGRIVRGESIDVAKMLTASEALAKLCLPQFWLPRRQSTATIRVKRCYR